MIRRTLLGFAVAAVVLIGVGATPAGAEGTITIDTGGTGSLDLTKDTPVLKLELLGAGDVTWPITLDLTSGVELADGCDLVARRPEKDTKPVTLTTAAPRTIEFTQPGDCDLKQLAADSVQARNPQINGGASFEVKLKTDKPLPLKNYSLALLIAIVAAFGITLVSAMWARCDWKTSFKQPDDDMSKFWQTPMDGSKLTWSFSGSWLTSFTALGTAFAGLFALTDVLTSIGLSAEERASVAFLDFGALIVAAFAPIAYLGLRRFKVPDSAGKTIGVRIEVEAHTDAANDRALTAWVPELRYEKRNVALTTPTMGAVVPIVWPVRDSDEHNAALTVPMRIDNNVVAVEGGLACVALSLPSAGSHPADATLLFDVEVPILTLGEPDTDGKDTYKQLTTDKTRYEAHGTMTGFVVAAGFAATAAAMQLALFQQTVEDSKLGWLAKVIAFVALGMGALLAVAYVVFSIRRRVPEALSAKPEDTTEPSGPTLRYRWLSEQACRKTELTPVAPSFTTPIVIPAKQIWFPELVTTAEGWPGLTWDTIGLPTPARGAVAAAVGNFDTNLIDSNDTFDADDYVDVDTDSDDDMASEPEPVADDTETDPIVMDEPTPEPEPVRGPTTAPEHVPGALAGLGPIRTVYSPPKERLGTGTELLL